MDNACNSKAVLRKARDKKASSKEGRMIIKCILPYSGPCSMASCGINGVEHAVTKTTVS